MVIQPLRMNRTADIEKTEMTSNICRFICITQSQQQNKI